MQDFCATINQILCDQVLCLMRGTPWKWDEPLRVKLTEALLRDFPPTNYVCDSYGTLIHFDGTYDVEKHRQAWERSKKWIPWWNRGTLDWMPRARGGFQRISGLPRKLFEKTGSLQFHLEIPEDEPWSNGLPPMQLGMLGVFKKQKAIVVERIERVAEENSVVGIGDQGCFFKDFLSPNRAYKLGKTCRTHKEIFWKIRTAQKDTVISAKSTRFTRSLNVVRDLNGDLTVYL